MDELAARYDEIVEDPMQDFINHRMATMQMNKKPTLVEQIPSPRAPQMRGLGASSLQVTPYIPQEREFAQNAAYSQYNGTFPTFEAVVPPQADCVYESIDQGLSAPEFFRASMHSVPNSSKLREKTHLPLALLLRPLARPEVPTADFSLDSLDQVPRCQRCRGYMNPSMRFQNGGSQFQCNLCHFVNKTPDHYFAPTTVDGRRVDWEERPELAFGTYDFLVGRKYGKPKSQAFKHVFLCQTWTDAANCDLMHVFSTSMLAALPVMKDGDEIAIVLFDKYIRALRLKPANNADSDPPFRTEMLTFLPKMGVLPPDIFLTISAENRDHISALISSLPSLITESELRGNKECCFGDAVESVLECPPVALNGARITVSLATIPTGKYALRVHDPALSNLNDKNDNGGKDVQIETVYKLLAKKVVAAGSGIDVFVIANRGPICLHSLSFLALKTGGRLAYFPRFVPERDIRATITNFLILVSEREIARSAELGLRCSVGLRAEPDKLDEIKPTFFDSRSSVLYMLQYDSILDANQDVHFQAALLFTDASGLRRVRVFNLLSGVTNRIKHVLKFTDSDVVLAAITRQAVNEALQAVYEEKTSLRLKKVRAAVMHKLEYIFGAARLYTGQGLPNSQMMMPTSIRQLAMLGLALAKTPVLGVRAFSSDFRAYNAYLLATATPNELALQLYPRVYDIGRQCMIRAKFGELESGSGMCLVFTGQLFFMFISKHVDPQLLMNVWGLETIREVPSYSDCVPEFSNEDSEYVRALMAELPLRVGLSWCPLQIVRIELDGAEYILRAALTEDGVDECPNFDRFLHRLHDRAKSYEEKEKWF